MNLTQTQHGAITVLQPQAERLDAGQALAFKEAVREVMDAGNPHIVLDLSSIGFMDSSGLGAVVSLLKYTGKEGKFELAGLSPMVSKVFALTRMDKVFHIYSDTCDALGAPQAVAV